MNSTQTFDGATRTLRVGYIAWGISLYPIFILLSLYTTWLLAWLSLGHPPIPSADDPKFINALVSTFHTQTIILLIGFYAVLPLNIFFLLLAVVRRRVEEMDLRPLALLAGLGWACCFLILKSDPGQVLYWFMD